MAGHSHWKQVKHKKGSSDAKRGQLFSKLVKEIAVAAREGGASPDTNVRLRAAMERAKKEGLPKDNIERALERAQGKGGEEGLAEFFYEATASEGIMVLIEGITDSKNRSLAEIKHLLVEHSARLAEQGSLIWNFEKVGTLTIVLSEQIGKTRDDIEAIIIESGASDFRWDEDVAAVETVFSERERVRAALEQEGITITEAGHDYKPRATVSLPPQSREALEALLDVLADHDDVQEVYTNITN